MYKIDLHTHSAASPDGGVTLKQYEQVLESGLLDVIAITDHNHIDFALHAQKQLGDKIIVGEEIMTTHGEIVGLYLTERVEPGLSPIDTIKHIKDQGGLVYIPHPFETVRKGLHPEILETLIGQIDIMEVCNGRAFMQNRSAQAVIWAKLNKVVGAASSDAHGVRGLSKTYTQVSELPARDTLMTTLLTGIPKTDRPSVRALLYPKYHRIRKRIKKSEQNHGQ